MYHGDQIAPMARPGGVGGRRAAWPRGEERGLTPRFLARAA
jgi:hypothetical protein